MWIKQVQVKRLNNVNIWAPDVNGHFENLVLPGIIKEFHVCHIVNLDYTIFILNTSKKNKKLRSITIHHGFIVALFDLKKAISI